MLADKCKLLLLPYLFYPVFKLTASLKAHDFQIIQNLIFVQLSNLTHHFSYIFYITGSILYFFPLERKVSNEPILSD